MLVFTVSSANTAVADCASDGNNDGRLYCSGAGIPVLSKDKTKDFDYFEYFDVTADFGPDRAADGAYALEIEAHGKEAISDNKNGEDGGSVRDTTVTMKLDQGHGIASETGGIGLESKGGDGGAAEDDKNWGYKTAYGGHGGSGGDGAKIQITLESDENGKTPASLSAKNGAGVFASSLGGEGSGGGSGSVDRYTRDGHGGKGGVGGAGKEVDVDIQQGISVDITSRGTLPGIGLFSVGANGGFGGGGIGNRGYGGDSGVGGDGGNVSLSASDPHNSITMSGKNGHGILAFSEAGDGGHGGAGSGNTGYGKDGAQGGAAGTIDVAYSGIIHTAGATAQGILLQSHGGAGGDGGSGKGALNGKGGASAGPGPAGSITLKLENATVTTKGDEAAAILMQSIGGFAGSAGAVNTFIAYGASVESGGGGAKVHGSFEESIRLKTEGDASPGIVALSIGGGGGTGSKNDGFVAMGSNGGAGGNGGDVEIVFKGHTNVTTAGTASAGLLALSVGGGGGHSGGSDAVVALGAQGGKGGDAGIVSVDIRNDLSVSTAEDHAVGLYIAGIGLGGGKATSPRGAFALGSTGGAGGDGNEVSAAFLGLTQITTKGENADGVILHSIGGGGGHGGNSATYLSSVTSVVGGTGGDGGGGGEVWFDGGDNPLNSDTGFRIETHGNHSNGFVASSVGGGGGKSGSTVTGSFGFTLNQVIGAKDSATGQHGGAVTVGGGSPLSGTVETHGDNASGVIAQSTGGGGGIAGASTTAGIAFEFGHTMGADGGKGGDGGVVVLNSMASSIKTKGQNSDALVAQSIGGAGGHSGTVVDANVGVNIGSFTSQNGAKGGAGGSGGAVTLTSLFGRGTSIETIGDNANGLLAQSVGGGGGKAGTVVDADVTLLNLGSVTLGQSGGAAGDGGIVNVENFSSISTMGKFSNGVLAQSVGRGGGQSGTTISGKIELGFGIVHGGGGGTGGSSGDVTLKNYTPVSTAGQHAMALHAQSIAGGGGVGGVTVDGTLSMADVGVVIGSEGGGGGTAGKVSLYNQDELSTTGNQALGIIAQSVAGAGGSSGVTIAGNATAGEISGSATIAVGGSGGTGGKAGDVDVKNIGHITTEGFISPGIAAQSVGGDGGTGGLLISGAFNLSTEAGAVVNFGVGGAGGNSGEAGDVEVRNLVETQNKVQYRGDISTTGDLSNAIFAQSIGGSGGSGGGSYVGDVQLSKGKVDTVDVTMSVGGSGGNGALGGAVTVENSAALKTEGGNSHALYAQSVGGNGGKGGFGILAGADLTINPDGGNFKASSTTSVGGTGGEGSDANVVTVENTGDIYTSNGVSHGIYAQSVGGGGGEGGANGSYFIGYTKTKNKAKSTKMSLSVDLGGSGGASGDGNDVSVLSKGTIQTDGDASYAIYAQSVGAGGGNAHNGPPPKKDKSTYEVWVEETFHTGEIIKDIYEVYSEISNFPASLMKLELNIGGKGGANGDGGNVEVSNDGMLNTKGESGTAIYVQSIGGGGGNAGDASSGLLSSLSVTQKGSGGGDGGNLSVSNSGEIHTSGNGAMGIYAQTVGGGGGTAGDIEGTILNFLDNIAKVGIGLQGKSNGGKGGNGGNIDIDTAGTITTHGESAHGVWAQSVGGGGGAGGSLETDDLVAQNFEIGIGSAGDEGDAGSINLNVDGSINVKGRGAHGIYLNSSAGAGGYSGGNKIYVSGKVVAEGINGRAILSQISAEGDNDPSGSGNDGQSCHDEGIQCRGTSHIYVKKGAIVQTNSEKAYQTIAFAGGRTIEDEEGITYSNQLTNSGHISSASAESNVIGSFEGGLRVHNQNGGYIYGSVEVLEKVYPDDRYNPRWKNTFENHAGATFAPGTDVNLGYKGTYVGSIGSMLSPHGIGSVGTTRFYGSYSDAGTLHIDAIENADGTFSNDKIVFDGNIDNGRIRLAGEVKPVWISKTSLQSGDSGKLLIAEVREGATLDELSAKPYNFPAITYTLSKNDIGSEIYAGYTVDYSGATSGLVLSANAYSYANYFNDLMVITSDTASLGILAKDFLNSESGDALERIYLEHSPDEYLLGVRSAVSASHALNELLQSCPTIERDSGLDFLRQNDCTWATATGSRLKQDATSGSPDFAETTWGFAIGAQGELASDTFLEVAGQIENMSGSGPNFSQDGDRYSMGVALKREIGRFTLSSTVTGGVYSFDHERSYTASADSYLAMADVDGHYLGAELRASAVVLGENGFYLKPSAALAYTRVWQDDFTETGDGSFNWNVSSVSKDWLAFTPAIEVGQAFSANEMSFLTYLRAGASVVLNDSELNMSSGLSGFNTSAGQFNGSFESDNYSVDLAAGLEVNLRDKLTMSFQGLGSFSDSRRDFGGSVQIEFRF